MTADELRDSISASLRARHGADVHVAALAVNSAWRVVAIVGHHDNGDHCITGVCRTEASALRSLAISVGLNPDGTDPLAELEALKRKLARAHAAVLEFAPPCKSPGCWCSATREFYDENVNTVAVCDSEACARELGATEETEIFDTDHAEAIREAKGT